VTARRCRACAGHGVTRRDGRPYRTVEGSLAAMEAGSARDCLPCDGSGLAGGWPAGSFTLLVGGAE
jgi:hypothetical protein